MEAACLRKNGQSAVAKSWVIATHVRQFHVAAKGYDINTSRIDVFPCVQTTKGMRIYIHAGFFLFPDMLFMTQITSSALSVHTNLHTCCYQHVRSKERKCKRFL